MINSNERIINTNLLAESSRRTRRCITSLQNDFAITLEVFEMESMTTFFDIIQVVEQKL